MANLIEGNADDEMLRYEEAYNIKTYSGLTPEALRGGIVQHDSRRGVDVVFAELPSGGAVRIGERQADPASIAQTDVEAQVQDQVAQAQDGIEGVISAKGPNAMPTMDDYLAAGYTEQEVRDFEAQRMESFMQGAGADASIQDPVQMTPEQIQQYAAQPGAETVAPRAESLRDRVQMSIYNAMSAQDEPQSVTGKVISEGLQALTGSDLIDPEDKRFWSNYLTDLVDISAPGVGGAISADEGMRMFTEGWNNANPVDMLIGGALTGLGVAEIVPLVKTLSAPAREALQTMSPAAKNILADTIGASRAIAQGDKEMLLEVFQPSRPPQSLSAAAPTPEAVTPEYLGQINVEVPPSRGGLPGRISTRLPTAKKATEDPMTGELIIGYDELKSDPAVYDFNVNITKDYPNMRPMPDATTDQTAEEFITHVKDNLLYLHDQVPEATRVRSQLWYDGARNIATRWADEYDVPDTAVAGALAALSPQKDWYQNVSLAQRVLDVVRPKGNAPTQFTPEMEQTYRSIDSLNKPKYEPMLDAIRGKSYDQIVDEDPAVQNALRALFVRLHDQTYKSPDYRIVGPEGDFLDIATNANGSPSRVAWGSLNEISKAIGSIEAGGDVKTISRLMGERHKVRNFYNNIYDPNSPYGDVTIDTHAVAAGLLRPLSGNSLEVDHNFKNMSVKGRGTTKGSAVSGVSGNYGLYAEAYRRAAEERGILPRQMQSITWEAVRGLFPDTFKTAKNGKMIDDIWMRYRNGEIEIDEARRLVNEAAGGINPPTWE